MLLLRGIRDRVAVFRRFNSSDATKQRLLANLGGCVDRLQQAVPKLLSEQLPGDLIHPNIKLEVFPETHPGFFVAGSTAYKTTVKLIQLAACPLLVPRHTKLQILSMHVDKCPDIGERHVYFNWRSVSPDRPQSRPAVSLPHVWEPGHLIHSLGALLPEEYPVLAGSFEFGFDRECDKVLLHVIRNVEYLSRPDAQLLMA